MPATPVEIPALPVLLPVVAVAITLLIVRDRRRDGRMPLPRLVARVALVVYGAAVIAKTLFPMRIGTSELPWTTWIQLEPLVDFPKDPSGMLLNLALFVPFGLLVPLATRIRSVRGVTIAAALASLAIEGTQLITDLTISRGRIADVDDLIGNTLGGLVGVVALRLAMRLWSEAKRLAAGTPRTATGARPSLSRR